MRQLLFILPIFLTVPIAHGQTKLKFGDYSYSVAYSGIYLSLQKDSTYVLETSSCTHVTIDTGTWKILNADKLILKPEKEENVLFKKTTTENLQQDTLIIKNKYLIYDKTPLKLNRHPSKRKKF